MTFGSTDDRLPVVLGEAADALPGDAVIALPPAARHVFGCRCCGGADPLAAALAAAFVARARATRPWFDRVLLVGDAGQAARVAAVLAGDPVALARFRDAGCAPVRSCDANHSPAAPGVLGTGQRASGDQAGGCD